MEMILHMRILATFCGAFVVITGSWLAMRQNWRWAWSANTAGLALLVLLALSPLPTAPSIDLSAVRLHSAASGMEVARSTVEDGDSTLHDPPSTLDAPRSTVHPAPSTLADGTSTAKAPSSTRQTPPSPATPATPTTSAPFVASTLSTATVYHVPTCRYCRLLKHRREFQTEDEAKAAGLSPCETCILDALFTRARK